MTEAQFEILLKLVGQLDSHEQLDTVMEFTNHLTGNEQRVVFDAAKKRRTELVAPKTHYRTPPDSE